LRGGPEDRQMGGEGRGNQERVTAMGTLFGLT
jgi:hypothetical protein